jgi:hypothetical protein
MGRFWDFLPRRLSNQRVTEVIRSRYQTSNPSFRLINLPKMLVNPARKTATCNWIKAFFIRMAKKGKKQHNLDKDSAGAVTGSR